MVNCPRCGSSRVSKDSGKFKCDLCKTIFTASHDYVVEDIIFNNHPVFNDEQTEKYRKDLKKRHLLKNQDKMIIDYIYPNPSFNGPKRVKIDHLVNHYSYEQIDNMISAAKKDLNGRFLLESLDATIFELLCSNLNVYEGSHYEKVLYLLKNFSKSDLEFEVNNIYRRYEYKLTLENLDGDTYKYLCHDLHVSGSTINEEIENLLNENSFMDIDYGLKRAKAKKEFKKDLESLEVYVFNHVCKSLDIHSRYKKDKIDLLLLNYSISEIEKEINSGRIKLECKEKLESFKTPFLNYICDDLDVSGNNKKDKINNILESFSIKEINDEINKVEIRLDYMNKLENLEDWLFEYICDDLSIMGTSENEKIHYILNDYQFHKLKNILNNVLEKFSIFKYLKSSEFKIYYDTLYFHNSQVKKQKFDRFSEKEDFYPILISDFSLNELKASKEIYDEKMEFKSKLKIMSDTQFEIIQEDFNILNESKGDSIDYLISNLTVKEINRELDKITLFDKLDSLDQLQLNFIFNSFPYLNHNNDNINKIKDILNKNSFEKINSEISDANDKAKYYNMLMGSDKELISYLCYEFSIYNDLSSKNNTIFNLISNHSLNDIKLRKSNFDNKFKEYGTLNSLSERELKRIKLDRSSSKEEKIYYLIDKYSKKELHDLFSRIDEEVKCMDALNDLKSDTFILTSKRLSVPDLSPDEKIDFILNNHSIRTIYDEISSSYVQLYTLESLDAFTLSFLSEKYLSSEQCDKNDVALNLLIKTSYSEIESDISLINKNKNSYKLLNELECNILKILFKWMYPSLEDDLNNYSRYEYMDLIAKTKTTILEENLNTVLEQLDYISNNLQDEKIYSKVFEDFEILEDLSHAEKIEYLSLNYPLEVVVEKIDHYIYVSTFSGKIITKLKKLFSKN